MKLNRVVVTGYGLTSPIGNTPEEFWNNLKDGNIGIGEITKFDHSAFDVHNAAEINDFPFDKYFVKKDTNRFDDYSLYALYAAQEAVNNANLDVEALDKDRFGVIVASGIGGIREIEDQVLRLHEKGPKRVKPLTLPKALPNMAAGNVAMRFGANVSVNLSIQLVLHQMMLLEMPSVLSSLVSKISCWLVVQNHLLLHLRLQVSKP